MSELSNSSSSSDSESKGKILISRSHRQCPIQVIHAVPLEAVFKEVNQEGAVDDKIIQPTGRPRPCPCMHHNPPGVREAENLRDADCVRAETELEATQDSSEQEPAIESEVQTILVPGGIEGSLDAQTEGFEVEAMVESGEIGDQVGPPRCQNPRRTKWSKI